jgi:hypothetical protein
MIGGHDREITTHRAAITYPAPAKPMKKRPKTKTRSFINSSNHKSVQETRFPTTTLAENEFFA